MPRKSSPTLVSLTEMFLGDLQSRSYRPKTIAGYRAKLRRFTTWAATVGSTKLEHLSADLIKDYMRYLQQDRRWSTHRNKRKTEQPTLSPLAIRNYVRDVQAFATWLFEEKYTSENLLAGVRKPRVDETPIKPFSDEEIERIFRAVDPTDEFGLRDFVILHTLWDTGLRVGELVNVTSDDVDLAHCEIHVDHTKFGKWRVVGFGKQTQKYLARYLNNGRVIPQNPNEQHFFLSLDGLPLKENTIAKLCQRVAKKTGVHIHCHRFRHTFAVNMLRNGTDLRTLQRLMGHSDIRILSRYLNLADEDTIKAHQSNSPADRFQQQRQVQQRRLPIRRGGLRQAI